MTTQTIYTPRNITVKIKELGTTLTPTIYGSLEPNTWDQTPQTTAGS